MRQEEDPEFQCGYCDGYGYTVYEAAVEPFRQRCDNCGGTGDRYYNG